MPVAESAAIVHRTKLLLSNSKSIKFDLFDSIKFFDCCTYNKIVLIVCNCCLLSIIDNTNIQIFFLIYQTIQQKQFNYLQSICESIKIFN